MILAWEAPREAVATAQAALNGLADLDLDTLKHLHLRSGQRLAASRPLPWFQRRLPRELENVSEEEGDRTFVHAILSSGGPIGTIWVHRTAGRYGVRSISLGLSGIELVTTFRNAVDWVEANPTSDDRLLFGFKELAFGIQSLVVQDTELHFFPIKPVPIEVASRSVLTVGEFQAGLERWGRRLKRG